MLIRALALLLIVVGAAGFLAPFWLGPSANSIELPLVEIEDVAAEDDRLFFALMHLGHVQVYARDGTFIRNFHVDNAGGAFCLDGTDGKLTVAVARRDAADTLDLDGRPIQLNAPITEEQYSATCARDPDLRAVDESLADVTVFFADGRPPLTIKRRWWHYLAYGPFASWFLFALGLILWPEWRRAIWKRIRGGSRNG